jgi:hypothetical protein
MSHVAQEQKQEQEQEQEQEQGGEADRQFEGRSTAQLVQVVQGLQVERRRRSVLRTQEAMLTINSTVLTTKGTAASRLRPSRHFSVSPVCPPGASRIRFLAAKNGMSATPSGSNPLTPARVSCPNSAGIRAFRGV